MLSSEAAFDDILEAVSTYQSLIVAGMKLDLKISVLAKGPRVASCPVCMIPTSEFLLYSGS